MPRLLISARRWLTRARDHEGPTTGVLSLIIALAVTWPIFAAPGHWGIQDWDVFLFFREIARSAIVDYGQVPLWNPHYCGGAPGLAHPESSFLSPFFLVDLAFGVLLGARSSVVLHLALGMWGSYLLARNLGMGTRPAWVAAFVYMLSSMFTLNVALGMFWFLTVAYVPWAVYGFRRSLDDRRWCLGAAAPLALMYLEGGAYPVVITAVLLWILAAGMACQQRRLAPLLRVALGFVVSGLLASVKIVPSLEFMSGIANRDLDESGYGLGSLAHALLARDQSLASVGYQPDTGFQTSYGIDENALYIGILAFALFGAGLYARAREQWPLVLALVVLGWVALGTQVGPSLWSALHHLPVYGTLRVAQRFKIGFMLPVALFAGFGLDFLARRLGQAFRIRRSVFETVIMGLLFVDLVSMVHPMWWKAFSIPPISVSEKGDFRQVDRSPRYDQSGFIPYDHFYSSYTGLFPALLSNTGTLECGASIDLPRAAIPSSSPEYRGEAFLVATAGEARITSWSPNRVRVSVRAERDGLLVLNQNMLPGWKAVGGGLMDHKGLVAVRVGPGRHEIELRYLPNSFLLGAFLSGATLAAIAAYLLPRRSAMPR